MPNTKISDLNTLTAASGDQIPINRAGADGKIVLPLDVAAGGTGQTSAAEAIGELTQALTSDTNPDWDADYVPCYDASADTGKKLPMSTVFRQKLNSTTGAPHYIRADGDDANDGLSDTPGGAWKTLQKAVNWQLSRDFGFDDELPGPTFEGWGVTFNIGPGTFAGVDAYGPGVGQSWGEMIFNGSGASTIITPTGNAAFHVQHNLKIAVANMTINASPDDGPAILCGTGSQVHLRSGVIIALEDADTIGIIAGESHGFIKFMPGSAVTFDGPNDGDICILAELGGVVYMTDNAVITNSPAWSTGCVMADTGGIIRVGTGDAWTGTATGPRFFVRAGGKIYSNNQGLAYFPGDAAGYGDCGGLYDNVSYWGTYTVTNLPTASEAGVGARAFVTDATTTTFASTVAGTGSNKVPVFSDGTNWLIG